MSQNFSSLEKQILGEYSKLVKNLSELNSTIQILSTQPTTAILDSLRGLEKKMGLVLTLFKASVYSIIVANEEAEYNDFSFHDNQILSEFDSNRHSF